ncbi:hypothetical protein L6E12_23625 [Actinokineospora sp. PR83]|uniref:NACHT domain-containing protein n=1 Tax=Actinokineospora sp. PR83 TaxID=2884908 RepID=UPI001F2C2614|nr:hypothetical protein [Actinokineospora sp. PR83]MCG8918775.1 hypothetical protein [Actinokineospora sp. PR83]
MNQYQRLSEAALAFRPSQNKIVKWAEANSEGDAAKAEALIKNLSPGLFTKEGGLVKSLRGLQRSAMIKLSMADRTTQGDVLVATHTILAVLAVVTQLSDASRLIKELGSTTDSTVKKLLQESPVEINAVTIEALLAISIPAPALVASWRELQASLHEAHFQAAAPILDHIVQILPDRISDAFSGRLSWIKGNLAYNSSYQHWLYLSQAVDKNSNIAIWLGLRESDDLFAPEIHLIESKIAHIRKNLRRKPLGLAGMRTVRELKLHDNRLIDAWHELARLYNDEIDRAPSVPRLPVLRDSYINPAYRVAAHDVDNNRPHEEAWWKSLAVHDEIQEFLVRYLASPSATALPLLVLGHPGAGKSVFTRVLAAQLGAMNRPVVRVDLRSVAADAPIYLQLSSAVEKTLTRRIEWDDLVRTAHNEYPVVILDGLDELIQSSAVSRADYLELVQDFQRSAVIRGCPVIVVVTSRTVVAQRVRIPASTPILRLEPFDDERIGLWLEKWNQHNASHFATTGRKPLSRSTVLAHRDLAIQPLLLFMLALYDSNENALQREGHEFVGGDLYERLLESFAVREIKKLHPYAEEGEVGRLVEQELERLSVAAFAMFNRGSQAVLEDELAADLDAFTRPAGQPARSSEVSDKARKLVSRFFFVHVSQATSVDGGEERTKSAYEFLHATFGEYLVARLTHRVVMHAYESTRYRDHALTMMSAEPDYAVLGALLSFELLCTRNTVTSFLGHMASRTESATVQALTALLARALRDSLHVDNWGGIDGYRPQRTSIPVRLSLRTANLLLLVVIFGGQTTPADLFHGTIDPREEWERLAALWYATLPVKSWQLLTDTVEAVRDADGSLTIRQCQTIIIDETYEFAPSLEQLRRLGLLVHDQHIHWGLSALQPLMTAAPAGSQQQALSSPGAKFLMQLAFPPLDLLGQPDVDSLYSLISDGVNYAETCPPRDRRVFLDHMVRLTKTLPTPLPTWLAAHFGEIIRSLGTEATHIAAELLYEMVRLDRPLPRDLDRLRQTVLVIAALLESYGSGPRQVPIALGLARLGLHDRQFPSRLRLSRILFDPASLWASMGEDPHMAARLLEVIRTTSRQKAAARAVHLLALVQDLNPLAFQDLDIRYVLAQARKAEPGPAKALERRWEESLLRHEHQRISHLLNQVLYRRDALTRIAGVLRAAANRPGQTGPDSHPDI